MKRIADRVVIVADVIGEAADKVTADIARLGGLLMELTGAQAVA